MVKKDNGLFKQIQNWLLEAIEVILSHVHREANQNVDVMASKSLHHDLGFQVYEECLLDLIAITSNDFVEVSIPRFVFDQFLFILGLNYIDPHKKLSLNSDKTSYPHIHT